jgi:SAM-dependent methyltransferase
MRFDRALARQFARPSGLIGRLLIGPWLDRISAPMSRLAREMLAPKPGERLLDVGFGGGGLIAALHRAGAVPIGVDVSETMVARGRRRFPGIELHCAPAHNLPLADSSVAKAVSLNSLYFWVDPAAGFAELARVIVPGGRLVIGFEPPQELRKWPGHRHGFRLFEVQEVTKLMSEAGFGSIEEKWGCGRKPDLFCCLSGARIGANR